MHTKRHNKPFACHECPHKFGSKKELDRHRASIHSEEKPFRCAWPNCKRSQKGWPREDNYHRHVRTVHGGEAAPPPAGPVAAGYTPDQAATPRKRRKESEESEGGPCTVMDRGDTSVQVATLQRIVDELTAESSRKDEEIRMMKDRISDLGQRLAASKEISDGFREMYNQLRAHAKIVQEER